MKNTTIRAGILALLAGGALILGMQCGVLKGLLYTGINRDGMQKPKQVLSTLGVAPGMAIADVGAGAGYFTWKFSTAVGPGGMVYAVDVDPDMLSELSSGTAKRKLSNVRVVDARAGLGGLSRSVDLAFLCNSFHMIENRVDYLKSLRTTLRPGGRVAVIDLRPEGLYGLWGHHGTTSAVIRREMRLAGYAEVNEFDFLPEQNFLLFQSAPVRQ